MRGNFTTNRRGDLNPNYKHGMRHTRLFGVWSNMKTRCYNEHSPTFNGYGSRGITVCDEWKNDFQLFYEYVSKLEHFGEPGRSLDRIDNDGNYEPGNVRWATQKEQSTNRRDNHLVDMNGETKALSEWCEEYGINYKTVRDRLKRGWSYQDALQLPVQTKFRRKVI